MKALIGLGVVSVFVVLFLAIGPRAAEADPACVLAQNWVDEHRNDLPETYEAFSEYGMSYRRAIYRAHPPHIKIRLWETHLDLFAGAHPELTAEQLAFIEAERSKLGEYMVADPSSGIFNEATERAIAILGRELTQKAFVRLGADVPSAALGATFEEDCNCDGEVNSIDCGIILPDEQCDYMGDCETSWWGCGYAGLESCLGLCAEIQA